MPNSIHKLVGLLLIIGGISSALTGIFVIVFYRTDELVLSFLNNAPLAKSANEALPELIAFVVVIVGVWLRYYYKEQNGELVSE